jgi:hypothetical protein
MLHIFNLPSIIPHGLICSLPRHLGILKKKTLLGKHLNLATYQKCDEFHDSTITIKCKIIEVTLCLNALKYLPKEKSVNLDLDISCMGVTK